MKNSTKRISFFVGLACLALIISLAGLTDIPEIGYSNVNFTVWDGSLEHGINWSGDPYFSVVIITDKESCLVKNPSPQKYFFQIESLDRHNLTDVRYKINLRPGRYVIHTKNVIDSSLVQSRNLTIERS